MKKSGQVGLVLIAALGLASCGRNAPAPVSRNGSMSWDDKPRDPCSPEHFNDATCQSAVRNRGYHYGGYWFPMVYSHGYRHYYDSHRNHLARGGPHATPPASLYSPQAPVSPNIKPPSTSASGTQRGGFGSTAQRSSPPSSSAPHVSAGS
jgi:hypothetical protein